MTEEEQKALEFRLQQLARAEAYLEEAVKSGSITKHVYNRSTVAVASDYVSHGRVAMGTEALRRVDPKYFGEEQRQDMEEDQMYAKLVLDLAAALVQLGLASETPVPAFTQTLGRA